MMIERPSPNFDARAGDITCLILHYTGLPTAEAAINHMCDPASKVAAHYLIDEAGQVFSLVDEGRRAWHAGVSYWRGARDLNSLSVGIELQNPGHEFGYRAFPGAQIDSLKSLSKDIIARHDIDAAAVIGHSDVAPERKQDPGELFPWEALAGTGIGVWHGLTQDMSSNPAPADAGRVAAFVDDLARIGYESAALEDPERTRLVITAFQRHWRPALVNGLADAGSSAVARKLAGLSGTTD